MDLSGCVLNVVLVVLLRHPCRLAVNIHRLKTRPCLSAYVVRGHDIKKVAVVGVEGHDVVDGFAGWQLRGPLTGQGHVREEGQLRTIK